MTTLAKRIQSFFTSEDGPTLCEYAVMAALVALMAISVISLLWERGTIHLYEP